MSVMSVILFEMAVIFPFEQAKYRGMVGHHRLDDWPNRFTGIKGGSIVPAGTI